MKSETGLGENTAYDRLCHYSWHADEAQQAFLAGARPTLHNALPTIEKMYSAWQMLGAGLTETIPRRIEEFIDR